MNIRTSVMTGHCVLVDPLNAKEINKLEISERNIPRDVSNIEMKIMLPFNKLYYREKYNKITTIYCIVLWKYFERFSRKIQIFFKIRNKEIDSSEIYLPDLNFFWRTFGQLLLVFTEKLTGAVVSDEFVNYPLNLDTVTVLRLFTVKMVEQSVYKIRPLILVRYRESELLVSTTDSKLQWWT